MLCLTSSLKRLLFVHLGFLPKKSILNFLTLKSDSMKIDINMLFKIFAYGFPALIGGIGAVLILFGSMANSSDMVGNGWGLVIFAAIIYILEIVLKYK